MKFIVAVDKEWGIGYKGDLLARVRADLKNFQLLTKEKIVVYGSNTLATFPGGRVLKNRTNIVLNPSPDYKPEGAIVVHSLDELFEELKKWVKKFSMCCDLLDAIYNAKKSPSAESLTALCEETEKYNSDGVILTGFCLREMAEKTIKNLKECWK